MEYAKYIKAHPLPELTESQLERAYAAEVPRYWNDMCSLYTARVVSKILEITIYGKSKAVVGKYRHLFDGEGYATQRIEDGKKLVGTIRTYLSTWRSIPLDDESEEIIKAYFDDESADISTIQEAEEVFLSKKLNRKHDAIKERIDKRMAIVPEIPKAFDEWLRNTILLPYRYYFYGVDGKRRHGYCSHCKTVFEDPLARHGQHISCPVCHSLLTCKALGRTTKYTFSDRKSVVLVQRAEENGEPVLIQRFFEVKQSISGHQLGAQDIKIEQGYFEETRSFRTLRLEPKRSDNDVYTYIWGNFLFTGEYRWCESEYSDSYCGGYIFPAGIDELADDIGVPNVQLTAITSLLPTNLVKLSELVRNYPVAENLAKQGFTKLLLELNGSIPLIPIFDDYVRAGESSPASFLGVDKPTLRALGDISPEEFILFKLVQEPGKGLELYQRGIAIELNNCCRSFEIFLREHRGISPRKAVGYLEKQSRLLKRKGYDVLSVWSDYLSMAADLRMKPNDDVLFPKNVQKEHDVLVEIKTALQYREEEKMLAKRGEILHSLDWTDGKFLIVAFDKPKDFLKESEELHHCVKTYIRRCAEGKTNIYGIRRVEEPDKPYFTLTLDNNAKITTNLGLRNCRPPKEVCDFVKKWEKAVIKKKGNEFIKAVKGSPEIKIKEAIA